MPGRRNLRPAGGGGGGGGDKEKGRQGGSGVRKSFATFWANASYKSFVKPNIRETEAGGSRSDLEDETGEGAGQGRPSVHRYDTDSTPSLTQHLSSSDDSSHHPPTDPDLEQGLRRTRVPTAPGSLRIPNKRTPSPKFTTHQLLYVWGSHGLGAFVISGGINFAVAYAMYTQTDDPIRLFELPNTLIGDFAVTVIMQTIITWMIEMAVVNNDLRKASVRPIGFVDEPQLNDPSSPSSPLGSMSRRLPRFAIRWIRWFMLLDQPKAQRKRRGSIVRKLRYLLAQVQRAFVVSIVLFALLIGPTMGILMALGVKEGGDWVYASRWTPEIYKLLLGGVLALLTSPFFAMYWMIKCGWNGGIHESVMINGNETK